MRSLAPTLAAREDGMTEVLALIWGPRFDREHACALVTGQPPAAAQALRAAADRFDDLRAHQQQRLRRRVAAGAGATMPHDAHSAD
jgi:hypothetical protein